jgi:glycosyltransferase involved in cell wall biosynthesis
MRVLTVVSDLRPGGTQRVACNFARAYQRAGLASAVFAHRGGGALEASLSGHDVDYFPGAAEEGEFRKSCHRALEWRPDVVHLHREGPADARTGYFMREAKKIPRIASSAPVGIMETNVFGRVDYSADATNVDVHFLLSKWCLWKWRQWSKSVRWAPVGVVLPNLVMHQEFYPLPARRRHAFRQKLGIPQDALLFGRVGSPIESKWSAATLEAFDIYARSNPNAWLLLIGMSDEMRAAVHALPGISKQRITLVTFLNGDEALREAYASMDVFLHASRIGESFGMVLAEALCCGTPVITLSTPIKDNSQLEVVGHEDGGLVAASVSGMVEAMRRLEDAVLREQFATRGAARIVRQFGPEALVPRAIEFARLTAAGLPRSELSRRVAMTPGACTEVSGEEIRSLMRRCIGQYSVTTPTWVNLVSNPFLYKAYRAVTGR